MGTTTLTIVDFLSARLDEDEAIAQAAFTSTGCGYWSVVPYVYGPREDGYGDPVPEVYAADSARNDARVATHCPHEGGGVRDLPTAEHIARHDPPRVLADVAAKRDVIEQLQGAEEQINSEWGTSSLKESDWVPIFARMAAVYSDHPDYQPEWRV